MIYLWCLGLLVWGPEFTLNTSPTILHYEVVSGTLSVFSSENKKLNEVFHREHATFLMVWMSEYIGCTRSTNIVLIYSYYVGRVLASNTGALISLILPMIYRALYGLFSKMSLCRLVIRSRDLGEFFNTGFSNIFLNWGFTRSLEIT